jgi:hypothetical protein
MFDSFFLSKLTAALPEELAASFEGLAPDTISYNRASGGSRRRHFGAFKYGDGWFSRCPSLSDCFNGQRDFHLEYEERQPQGLSASLVDGGIVMTLLDQIAPALPIPLEAYAIGVNQIRVTADDDNMGSPAPGLHQDGYDFSCHLAVGRRNVSGGTSIISLSKKPDDVVFEHNLHPGEFIFFNDRAVFHTATPVTCRIGGFMAARDMIIIDFVRRPD